VNVTIDNSNTPWEILLKQFNDADVRQLPHMITIQCSFKPIMDLLPRKESYNNPFVPLIANRDHYLDPVALTTADQQAPSNVRIKEASVSVPTPKPSSATLTAPTVFTGRVANIKPLKV